MDPVLDGHEFHNWMAAPESNVPIVDEPPLHFPEYHSLLVKKGQNHQHPKSHKNPIVILLLSHCYPIVILLLSLE